MRISILSIGLGLILLVGACGPGEKEATGMEGEKLQKATVAEPEKAEPEKVEPEKAEPEKAEPEKTPASAEKIEPIVLDKTGVPKRLLGTWEKSEEPIKGTRMEFGREEGKIVAMVTLPPQTGKVVGAFRLATQAKTEDNADRNSCMAQIWPVNTKIFDEVTDSKDGTMPAKRLVKYYAMVNPCHVVKSGFRGVELKIIDGNTLESTMPPFKKGEPQVELWKRVEATPEMDSAASEEKK